MVLIPLPANMGNDTMQIVDTVHNEKRKIQAFYKNENLPNGNSIYLCDLKMFQIKI